MTTEHMRQDKGRGFRGNWVLIGFLLIAGFFLVTEHRAHLLGVLPFLLLAACPLMHLFMHHDPGHDGDGSEHHNHPGGREQP